MEAAESQTKALSLQKVKLHYLVEQRLLEDTFTDDAPQSTSFKKRSGSYLETPEGCDTFHRNCHCTINQKQLKAFFPQKKTAAGMKMILIQTVQRPAADLQGLRVTSRSAGHRPAQGSKVKSWVSLHAVM